MEEKLKKINCDPICGFSVQSHNENEVLNMAKTHVENQHPDKNYSDDDYREMMKTV